MNQILIALSAAVCLPCVICSVTVAQIVTDRPDQTESSSTVPKGSLQIESGILISYEKLEFSTARQVLLPTNLFRYGIAENLEVRVLSQLEMLKIDDNNLQGIGDLEVGAKVQLYKSQNGKDEVAFLTHLVVPTGNDGLSVGRYGSVNKLCVSHDFSDVAGMGFNLGYVIFEGGEDIFTYSLALGFNVNESVGFYIEPFGEIIEAEEFILNFDTGMTFLLNENLQLDFSFGTGAYNKMNYLSAGCSWLIRP